MTAPEPRTRLTTLAVTRPLPFQSRPATRDAGPQCVVEGRIQNVAAVIIGATNAHGAAMTAPQLRQSLKTLAATRPLPRQSRSATRDADPQCVIEGRIRPEAAGIIGISNGHGAAMTAPQLCQRLTTLAVTRPLPRQSRSGTGDADPQCVIEGRIQPVAAVITGASNAHGAAMAALEPRQRLTTLAVTRPLPRQSRPATRDADPQCVIEGRTRDARGPLRQSRRSPRPAERHYSGQQHLYPAVLRRSKARGRQKRGSTQAPCATVAPREACRELRNVGAQRGCRELRNGASSTFNTPSMRHQPREEKFRKVAARRMDRPTSCIGCVTRLPQPSQRQCGSVRPDRR